MSHPYDYIYTVFQKSRQELPPKNCWEICLQIDFKSSMKTKIEYLLCIYSPCSFLPFQVADLKRKFLVIKEFDTAKEGTLTTEI